MAKSPRTNKPNRKRASRARPAATQKHTAKEAPPRWQKAFLAVLAQTGNVSAACRSAQVTRRTVYDRREACAAFAQAWTDAIEEAADLLEAEAWRRAKDGVDEPVIYQGELMGVWVNAKGEVVAAETPGARKIPLTIKRYSDSLLQCLLKACKPEKFRDRQEVSGKLQLAGGLTISPRAVIEAGKELEAELRERLQPPSPNRVHGHTDSD